MTRRRQLLMWGIPAVLGLAVVAAFVVLILTPPTSKAERQSKKVQIGMTLEQARNAVYIGVQLGTIYSREYPKGPLFIGLSWRYDDGSVLDVYIDENDLVDRLEVRPPPNNSWLQRLRVRLRKAGLPI